MAGSELEKLSSAQLFQLCAENLNNDEYWAEFLRRYNPVLVRSVYCAHQQLAQAQYLAHSSLEDLLQLIYLHILKDDCLVLRRFRNQTETAAQAYLAQIALRVTANYLRRARAQRRQNKTLPLDEIAHSTQPQHLILPPELSTRLAEREIVKLLERTFTHTNSRRDIRLFLLHVYQGMSYSELQRTVARNLQPHSVASTLTRMKRRLRRLLSAPV
jgi:DNA-directed RNA polymerase specialized sigma24 family protein